KQTGDVGEHVDGRANIIGICRQTRFGLQNYSHGTNRGQLPVGPCGGWFCALVDARHDRGEDILLETGGVLQVVLKELTRFIRFIAGLGWQETVRSVSEFFQPVLERFGEMANVLSIDKGRVVIVISLALRNRRKWN